MNRLLAVVAAALLPALVLAQEIPGVRATLIAPTLFAARSEVQLRLTLQIEEDVEVPATLLTGLDLTVRVNGKQRDPIQEPGRGDKVQLSKDTRIDRLLKFPAARIMNGVPANEVAIVSLGWNGLIGVDCSFKIAPDTKGMKVDDLDLSKTEVVLVTNFGDMRLGFRPDKAPRHARNFVKLCLQGFYDGTRFHRISRGFMIQGGCPHTKDEDKREIWGTGGAGYEMKLEPSDLRHLKGTISMARAGRDTASSGFFIVHRDQPHLDGEYSAFGNILEGIDTLERIANVPTGGPKNEVPLRQVIVQSAIVLPHKQKK